MELNPSRDHLPTSASFVDKLITELASIHPERPSTTTALGELDPPRTQTTQPKQPQNALSRLSPSQLAKVKPLLLTLHCLFPNDLLPALDILDRGLVQRLVVRGNLKINVVPSAPTQGEDQELAVSPGDQETRHDETDTSTGVDTSTPDDGHASHGTETLGEDLCLFLVTSASSAPAHPSISTHTQEPQKAYEVRLQAWNCTCPTFTLSAFRDLDARLRLASKSTLAEHPSRPAMLRDWDADADGGSGSATAAAAAVYPFGGTLTCTTDRDSPPACKHILACVLFVRCAGLFGGGGEGRGVLMEEVAGWCAGWGG